MEGASILLKIFVDYVRVCVSEDVSDGFVDGLQ